MATQILMPALSPTMEEGTLAKWLVKEGQAVKSGDILAEIETDKATMEFEAVDEGIISKLLIAEGTAGVKVPGGCSGPRRSNRPRPGRRETHRRPRLCLTARPSHRRREAVGPDRRHRLGPARPHRQGRCRGQTRRTRRRFDPGPHRRARPGVRARSPCRNGDAHRHVGRNGQEDLRRPRL